MSEGISLRDYIEKIMDEREKQSKLELAAQETRASIAATNLERRLENLNELRVEFTQARLTDQERFLTKAVFSEINANILNRINAVERQQSKTIGIAVTLVALMGIFVLVLEMIRSK